MRNIVRSMTCIQANTRKYHCGDHDPVYQRDQTLRSSGSTGRPGLFLKDRRNNDKIYDYQDYRSQTSSATKHDINLRTDKNL